MRTKVSLRELTPEECMTLERLAHSRTAEARLVERAQIILATLHGERPSAIARRLHLTRPTVYTWIHRFNACGVAGLQDRPRCGCPPTYAADQKAELIATALTDPQTLGLPFGCWTLDRLQTYLNEQRGIAIKRSRIDEILLAEGLRWREQETWFGEKVDPDFAKKRRSSKPSTLRRPSTVW
jgi:transposase